MKKKDKRVHVTMTEAEHKLLKKKADYIGLSLSAYIRLKCFDKLSDK